MHDKLINYQTQLVNAAFLPSRNRGLLPGLEEFSKETWVEWVEWTSVKAMKDNDI